MTTLDSDAGHLVLINTFTVEPDRADELLEILSRAGAEHMRDLPGFVSANLHISHDKRHVANYVQWRSQEDFAAMMANSDAAVHRDEAAAVASSYQPIFYRLCETQAAA